MNGVDGVVLRTNGRNCQSHTMRSQFSREGGSQPSTRDMFAVYWPPSPPDIIAEIAT